MTRCKAGDLAITEGMPMDNGILVEVVHSISTPGWEYLGPCWMVKSLGSPFHLEPTRLSHVAALPDFALRPIRDPGDDAVDETLQRLPAPTPEKTEA